MAGPPTGTVMDRIKDLFGVPYMMTISNLLFVKHFLKTLLTNPLSLNISTLRHRAFTDFLTLMPITTPPESPLFPFLAIQNSARGVVLDVGPGTGINTEYFNKDTVEMIYGAEPSEAMQSQLYDTVKNMGWDEKYRVMECGAEYGSLIPALKKQGLIKEDGTTEVFDTIVCGKVLCSVPNPKETIEGLVKLLKPGGKFMFNEHIRNRCETKNGSYLARTVQRLAMLFGWESTMAGCDLERDTADYIEQAGQWEDKRLTFVTEWASVPFCYGWYEKSSC